MSDKGFQAKFDNKVYYPLWPTPFTLIIVDRLVGYTKGGPLKNPNSTSSDQLEPGDSHETRYTVTRRTQVEMCQSVYVMRTSWIGEGKNLSDG